MRYGARHSRSRPWAAAGPWAARLVTALLAALAAVAVPATARPSVDPPGPARSVRVLSYNVCGASSCQFPGTAGDWLDEMETQAGAWDADVLMLQEVCLGQWNTLRTRLTGYGYVGLWATTLSDARCGKWGPQLRFGNGLFVRSGEAERLSAGLEVPPGNEPRGVLCARSHLDGRPTLICNTHLAQYIPGDNGMGQVLKHVGAWADGLPVILGGDFNAGPESPTLRTARAGLPGIGMFAGHAESPTDACQAVGGIDCAGEHQPGKFDHVLVSTKDFHTGTAAASEPGLSDHRLLFTAAQPR